MLHLSTEFYLEFSEDGTRTSRIYTRTNASAKESTDHLKLISRFGTIALSTIYIIYLLIIQGETMSHTVQRVEDQLADFTRDRRILLLSLIAVVIGALSALVAKVLVWLIGFFTNITFYQRFSADLTSPANNHLGKWVILAPVVGD